MARNDGHGPLKITDFGTDRKQVCYLLLVNNTSSTYVLYRTVSELLRRIGSYYGF